MKFFTDNREITTVRVDQAIAHKCYNASLEVTRKKSENKEEAQPQGSSKVMLVDLMQDNGKEEGQSLMVNQKLSKSERSSARQLRIIRHSQLHCNKTS